MVSVKEAVAKAIEFAQSILAQSVLDPVRISELRLEEVEMTKVNGEDAWSITLSMLRPQSPLEQVAAATQLTALLGNRPREYKTFAVNSQTGQVLSMKIRELANTE